MRSLDRRAFSIIEAVFSSFLLLMAVALTVYLFDSTLRNRAQNDLRLAAVRAAENVLEEIRGRAQEDFVALESSLQGYRWPTSDSSIEVTIYVEAAEVVVPNTTLEELYPAKMALPTLGKKILADSMLKVELESRWGKGANDSVVLVAYVADPRPNQYDLKIVPLDGTKAAPDQELSFRAVALGPRGERIDDLILSWYVEPISSFGTVSQVSRDGWDCVYKNSYEDYNSSFTSTAGTCRLVVRGVYRGREKTYGVVINNS